MKNYGPKGEVNQRLDDLDDEVARLQSELDPEKLWDIASGVLTPQQGLPNGPIDSIDLKDIPITGISDTNESELSDGVNVKIAKKIAIRYSLIL